MEKIRKSKKILPQFLIVLFSVLILVISIRVFASSDNYSILDQTICASEQETCFFDDLFKKQINFVNNFVDQEKPILKKVLENKPNLRAEALGSEALPLKAIEGKINSFGNLLSAVSDGVSFGWIAYIDGLLENTEESINLTKNIFTSGKDIVVDNYNSGINKIIGNYNSTKNYFSSILKLPAKLIQNKKEKVIEKNENRTTIIKETIVRVETPKVNEGQNLKGEKGDTGQTGETGLQGPQGMQGPAGQNGEDGDSLETSSFVTKNFLRGQVDRIFDSISEGIENLENKLSEEINTGVLTVTNDATINGSLNTKGQGIFSKIPTLAHSFSIWPIGDSNVSDASLFINPISSIANGNLIGAAIDGVVKFIVDAEGNIYGNNLILTGSVSSGSSSFSSLSVIDNTILGDAPTDTITINGTVGSFTMGGNLNLGVNTITTTNTGLVSSLNADLLDGQHGNYYASASSLSNYLYKPGILGGQTVIGGTDVTDILKLQGTSGSGALTSPAIQALVGNNGATTALTILNNGNVGVGTVSPSEKLSVAGNILLSSYLGWFGTNTRIQSATSAANGGATFTFYGGNLTGNKISNVANTANYFNLYSSISGDGIQLVSEGSDDNINILLTPKGTGKIGIGTTNPASLLHVQGSGQVATFGVDSPSVSTYFGINYAPSSSQSRAIFGYNGITGNVVLQGGAAKGIEFNVNDFTFGSGTAMVIKPTGNVGIGTMAPATKLDVNGNVTIGTAGDYGRIFANPGSSGLVIDSNSVVSPIVLKTGSNGFQFNYNNSSIGSLLWYGGGTTTTFAVTNTGNITNVGTLVVSGTGNSSIAGNVGIGTTAPGYKLDVTGNIYSSGYSIFGGYVFGNGNNFIYRTNAGRASIAFDTMTGGGAYPLALKSGDGVNYTGGYIHLDTEGIERMRINTNGNVGIGTTSPAVKLTIKQADQEYTPLWTTPTGDIALGIAANTSAISGMDFKNFNSAGQVRLMARNNQDDYIVMNMPGSASSATFFGQTSNNTSTILSQGATDADKILSIGTYNAGDLILGTSNTERMRILSTGNVGIGTASPQSLLNIGGIPGALSSGLTFGDGDTGIYELADDALQFQTNSGWRLYIANSNVQTGVDFYGGGDMVQSLGTSTRRWKNFYSQQITDNGTNVGIGTTNPIAKLQIGSGGSNTTLSFNLGATNTYSSIQSYNSNLALNPSGNNVGIGTTSPGAALHVLSSVNGGLILDTTSFSPYISYNVNNVNKWNMGHFASDSSFRFWSADPVYPSLTISSSGKMGIGTSDPSSRLEVYGSSGSNIRITDGRNHSPVVGDTIMQFEYYSADTSGLSGSSVRGAINMINEVDTSGAYLGMGFYTKANTSSYPLQRMRISSSGNVGIGTISPTAVLHLKAGTATTNTAPLKFTSGTNLTTAEAGAMEYDGTNLYFTPSGTTRRTIAYTSDLTGGYIPYTGGTTDVDLGIHNLTVDTNSLFVDSANHRVGIGTTSPLRTLHVNGRIQADGIIESTTGGIFFPGAGVLNDLGMYRGASYNARIQLSNTNIQLLNGNVGIGTVNPSTLLHLGNTSYTFAQGGLSFGDGDSGFYESSDDVIQLNIANTNLMFWGGGNTTVASNLIPSSNNTRSLGSDTRRWDSFYTNVITDNGTNVGIGTTNPTQQLEITKNFTLPVATVATAGGIIYKGAYRFLHDFSYGLNSGGITPVGQNIFIGLNSGNLSMGSTATSSTQASYNVAIGGETLYYNTLGYFNVAIGNSSMRSNTSGYYNTAIGASSLYSNTTGSSNMALGYSALSGNTTGAGNLAFGFLSLQANTTGSYNTSIGNNAGRFITDGVTGNTTGDYNIFLGSEAKALADDDQNEIVIGYNATGAGSNSVVLGNTNITKTILNGNVGIGTTNPTNKLEVNGGNLFIKPSTSGGFYVESYGGSGTDAANAIRGNGAAFLDIDADHDGLGTEDPMIRFSINAGTPRYVLGVDNSDSDKFKLDYSSYTLGGSSNLLTIHPNGNVGIGTTSPTTKLEVGVSADTTVATFNGGATGLPLITLNRTSGVTQSYGLSLSSGKLVFQDITNGKSIFYSSYADVGGLGNLSVLNVGAYEPMNNSVGSTGLLKAGGAGTTGTDTAGGNLLIASGAGRGNGVQSKIEFYTPNLIGTGTSEQTYSSRMTILGNGNVGIGTTNPTRALNVVGVVEVNSAGQYRIDSYNTILTQNYLSLYGQGKILSDGTGNLSLGDSNDVNLYIKNDGNIGIGTTTPASKLHIDSTISPFLTISGSGGGLYTDNPTINLFRETGVTVGAKLWLDNSGADLYLDNLRNDDAANIYFRTKTLGTAVNAMTILGTGNVGIGTTNPATKLDVSGGIYASSFIQTANNLYVGGNVGIGTTSPVHKLDVRGVTNVGISVSSSDNADNPYIQLAGDGGNMTTEGMKMYYVDAGPNTYFDSMFNNDLYGFRFRTKVAGTPVNALTILGSGNIGIGTITPLQKLHVNGDVLVGGTSVYPGSGIELNKTFTSTSGTDYGGNFYVTGSGTGTATQYGYYMSSVVSGNHTTSYGTASRSITSGNTTLTNSYGVFGTSYNNVAISTITNAYGVVGEVNANGGTLGTAYALRGNLVSSASTMGVGYGLYLDIPDNVATTTYGMYINSNEKSYLGNGNVGIGTTDPISLLDIRHVTGNAVITLGRTSAINAADSQIGALKFYNSDVSGDGPNYTASINAYTVDSLGSGGYLTFNTHDGTEGGENSSPLERVRIDASGNVGIGTSSPSYNLQVGNSSVSGIVARFENSTGTCDINPTTSSLVCSSDINLKKNIVTLDDVEFVLNTIPDVSDKSILEQLNYLTPVNYNWNSESDEALNHIGFIAQEVEQVFPGVVFTDQKNGEKSIAYTNLIPYAIKAIQELDLKLNDFSSLDMNSDKSLGSLIKNFLGNIENQINYLYANVINSQKVETKMLCVGDTCVTEEQFLEIVNKNVTTSSGDVDVEEEIIPDPEIILDPEIITDGEIIPDPEVILDPEIISEEDNVSDPEIDPIIETETESDSLPEKPTPDSNL